MNEAERKVSDHLEEQGFEVVNISPPVFLLDKFDSWEDRHLASALSDEIGRSKFWNGAPDLIVYKFSRDELDVEIDECFVVEVKSCNDSLRINQIDWFARVDVESYVAVVRDSVHFYKIEVEPESGFVEKV